LGLRSALGLSVAAVARWDGIPVRAGLRVPEEGTNALIELWADNVFKFAGLRVGLGIVDGKSVLKEALGQAVTANNITCALGADGREPHFAALHRH